MRITLCTALLIALAVVAPAMAQVNEWHAIGVVEYCSFVQTDMRGLPAPFTVVILRVGKNRPITCIAFDSELSSIYHYYLYCKDQAQRSCIVEVRGKLRATKFNIYIKLLSWQIKHTP